MIFNIFSKQQRNSKEKANILKAIYHDNLRMAGKYIEEYAPRSRWSGYAKPLQTLAVMLVVALFPFSELDPSLYVSANPSVPELPPVTAKMPDNMVTAAADRSKPSSAIKPIETAMSGSEDLVNESPLWDFVGPVDPRSAGRGDLKPAKRSRPGIKDYDLLLASNDTVRLSSVFGLGVKNIVIDPGHGGRDPGAIGAMGTMEKDITLDVAMKLRDRLVGFNRYNVLLTRENDCTLTLADRVHFAQDNKADIFISVHVNSLPNERINMIETYYFGAPLNSDTIRLAEQENKESHFSVGELDAIIQDLGNTLKRQESEKLATAIQASLFKNMKGQDAHVRDFGIKMAPFVVLSQIEVPSVLVEISCITKVEEEEKLASSRYRSKVAAYMEEGIVSYLEAQDFKLSRGEKINE